MSVTTVSQTSGFRTFAAMALVWLAAAYLAGQYVAVLPFGFVVLSVFLFAVPIAISGAYSSAVNQTRMMSYYKTSGWVYRIFSGRLIRSILWIIWALASSFVMLLQFSTYSGLEWMALGLAIPVFWYIHKFFVKVFSAELKKRYVISSFSITWSRALSPVLLVMVYAVLVTLFSQSPNYTSLAEAVAARRANTPETAGSSVVQIAFFLISFADGTKSYLGSSLKQFGEFVPLLLIILGSYMVFFNASATLATFAIPVHEHRRIYGPVSDDEVPPPLTGRRLAITAAIVTIVALFIYVPIFASLEDGARHNPSLLESLKNAQLKVEKIDDAFYRPGTRKAIELAKADALAKFNNSRGILEGQINLAFDQMESHVDDYLDWYYSLSGEYVRLAKMMTGEIEKYMADKLVEKLQQEAALKPVIAGLEVAVENYNNLTAQYQQNVKEILDNNRLQVPQFGTKRIPGIALSRIIVLPPHFDVISMKSRMSGAAAAGISTAIVGKIVSKSFFKAAAKALSEFALKKAAVVGGGMAIGGAIGFPAGPVAMVTGAIGGVIAGVVVDKLLLNLEEAIRRDDFKKEIIGSMRESRQKFKNELLGSPS